MKKIEILAPAGTMDAVYAAVINGADAIYCGGVGFGARAFAGNFNHEEMKEVLRFCHLRKVRVYVTMNTLIFEDEIENAMDDVAFYYHAGVDALIIQDLGLLDLVRKQYPDFELHASTQMHIHNQSGVQWLKKLGVKRVVLARETPIDVVKACASEGVDLEIFSYGALCISYSGQCLMSYVQQDRSGNRGKCAQCCRMKYQLLDDQGNQYGSEEEYLLSPKDLNVLEHLPKLIEAGVHSLKIEGRMKRPEYVGLVTRVFKEARDAYYEGKPSPVTNRRLQELKVMFNRGFTPGFLFSDGTKLMSFFRPNHLGIPIGEVVSCQDGEVIVELSETLNQGDGLRIINHHEDVGLVANKIEVDGYLVSQATAKQRVKFYHTNKVKKGDTVVKTSDALLLKQYQDLNKEGQRILLRMEYRIEIGKPIQLTLIEGKIKATSYSSKKAEQAMKSPITKERFEELLGKVGDTVYEIDSFVGDFTEFFLPVKIINEMRREAFTLLDELRIKQYERSALKKPYLPLATKAEKNEIHCVEVRTLDELKMVQEIYPEKIVFSEILEVQKQGAYPIHPVINELSNYQAGKMGLINELGGLTHSFDGMIASSHLNISNSFAVQCLLENGIHYVQLSHEVSNQRQDLLIEKFMQRNHFKPPLMDFNYGRRELMILKHCPVNQAILDGTKQNCTLCKSKNYWLKDQQGTKFLLLGDEQCIQHLLEEKPIQKQVNPGRSSWVQYDQNYKANPHHRD